MTNKIVKKQRTVFIILLILLLLVVVTFTFFWSRPEPEIKELKMDLIIGNHTGINLEQDAIHFGTVKKGEVNTLIREAYINNDDNFSKKVKFSVTGDFSEVITFSEKNFILGPQENRTIYITANVNQKMDYGTYEWILKVTIRRLK